MRIFTTFLCLFIAISTFSQGRISGNLQLNTNFYQRDTIIGAANTPQYDNQLSGTDAWLNLNYVGDAFDAQLRFDLFNNSNLRNPLQSYSDQGIGFWMIHKKLKKIDLTGGYFYDQIGSGIAFRAYEARPLAIDNALMGIKVAYNFTDNFYVKAFTGKQKNFFTLYDPIIKGMSADWFVSLDSNRLQLAPGVGVVNRTIDEQSMQRIATNISTYSPVDSFVPRYNVYVFSGYNTLTYKNISWYIEGVYKTHEAIALLDGQLVDRDGSVLYTSLSYARKGLGITVQAKRTENFSLRTSPNETLTRGLIGFIPPMARQNTYRLTARYNAATQELGELAFQADVSAKLNKRLSVAVNFSNITDLNNNLLYREIFTEATITKRRKYRLMTGVQFQQYNQEVFEQKVNVPIVQTIVPYIDYLYRLQGKKSIRTELQYMHTDQDFGSWINGLVEYTIAPHWSFSVSDMVTLNPAQYYSKTGKDVANPNKPVHFYAFLVSYTQNTNRFQLSYVKQVEGIVCTGGICRYEPAFSGIKLGVTSRF